MVTHVKSKLTMGSRAHRVATLLVIIILLSSNAHVAAHEDYDPVDLSLIIYSDGYVSIDYTVDVDPTKVQVNVTLFGNIYLDMLIEDQDGGGLDYSNIENGVTIDTIGSISALVSYFTTDLTSKTGQIWSLSIDTPISSTIILPEDATLTYSSVLPSEIGSLNGNPYIVMPSGDVNIEYTIGPVGTREHAQALITDAENTIDEVKTAGILVPEAEALLAQAQASFDEERYIEAEQLASQAKDMALDTQEVANLAQGSISDAESAISNAVNAGRTEGIDTAQDLLQQAQSEYTDGNYSTAGNLAEQAETAADNATEPEHPDGGVPMVWLLGGLVLVVAAVGGYFILGRRQEEPTKVVEKVSFDLDRLLNDYTHLRMDDKEVLRYLADNGGESFAAEIRDRFEIPRTSLWRMIRRLEGEGVITVDNIGGQSLVKINREYRVEGG